MASLFSSGVYGTTKFSLIYAKDGERAPNKAEVQTYGNFLRNIDLKVKNSIRFGVDKALEVRFVDFGKSDLNLSCDKSARDSYVRVSEEGRIEFNEKLKLIVVTKKLKDRVDGCSHESALVKALEKGLLNIKGAEDLTRTFTKKERKKIVYCENEIKRKGRIAFRSNRTMKVECARLADIKDRRRRFELYEYKINKILYRKKMEFDTTSFTTQTLEKYNICKRDYKPTLITPSGKKIKMLGMAIIYMPPGFNTSVMGHIAERYVYCKDDRLMDFFFEYTQMTTGELANAEEQYSKYRDLVDREYLDSLVGKIYMKMERNPAKMSLNGYGFRQFYANKDVIEIWPTISEQESYDGLKVSIEKWKDQSNRYKNKEPFEEYSLLNNNCTHPVRERLNKFAGDYDINKLQGLTPINIFGFIKNKSADRFIIYPGQRTLRKYKMLEKGESLFWENTTLWSQASEGSNGRGEGWMLLYPETHGFLNGLITNRVYGVVNLTGGVLQTLYGILTSPLNWLAKLPGFKFLKSKKRERHLANGIKSIGMSLAEIIPGLEMRYPRALEWTPEEVEFIHEELPHREPKILDYLMDKVHQ